MIRTVGRSVRCLAAALMLLAALAFGLHEIGEAEAAAFEGAPPALSVEAHLQEPLDHAAPDRPPSKAVLLPILCTLQAIYPCVPAPTAATRVPCAMPPVPSPARFRPGLDPAAFLRPPRSMAVA